MSRVLLLSKNENVKKLYDWLKIENHDVILWHEPINATTIEDSKPELVVSYNYPYIVKEDVIDLMGDNIINMHTSLLPWNKGASPNIWSFIEDTPKGVTIHRLEKGLDTGKILFQKELFFDEEVETLSSSYEKLNNEIVQLCIDNWDKIISNNYTLLDQKGKGSYHKKSDLEAILKGKDIDYSMTISEFKKFLSACEAE